MALQAGDRIGAYEIVELVGRGGMGEVYRALDTRLQRSVAIKLLLEGWNDRPDEQQRFEREARVLASLNHPNIAAIHDVTEIDGRACLVLEFVEGVNLSQRLRKGALPVRETMQVATQIASALSAAHDRGVIHRDLKPANIRIGSDGRIKVLDFGIAKSVIDNDAATEHVTATGMVMGTLAYMSPEQARGHHVSKQTDIWAFGCIVFEMLTGRLTFGHASGPETAAAILERDPDWQLLPAGTPPGVQRMVRRCLQKNPAERLHDVADARLDLEDALRGTGEPISLLPEPPRKAWQAMIVGGVIGAVIASAFFLAYLMNTAAPIVASVPTASLQLTLPADEIFASSLAASPDGRYVAYQANKSGAQVLILRRVDQPTGRVVAESNGPLTPFFSPDSQWVAFFSDGLLKKTPVAGGVTSTVCVAPTPRGGAWSDRNQIVFAPTFFGPLHIVSADGGTSRQLTTPGTSATEVAHRWPELLPGGDLVAFTVGPAIASVASWDTTKIDVQSIRSGERWTIVDGGTYARYIANGHRLMFVRAGTAYSAPLSANGRTLTGPPVPVVNSVRSVGNGAAEIAVSSAGWIFSVPAVSNLNELVWVDGAGVATAVSPTAREYSSPRLAPDERRIAFTLWGRSDDLYLMDLGSGGLTRLTFGATNFWPVWTDDGKQLFFASNRDGYPNLYLKTLDGTVGDERLTTEAATHSPLSWSPAAQILTFANNHPSTGIDLWTWSRATKRAEPFLQTPANESGPVISPNGRWVAYVSNESEPDQVYVRPLRGDAKWQVSTDGGREPLWLKDGSGLLYRSQAALMLVKVSESPTFAHAPPTVLFRGQFESPGTGPPNYDVTNDGTRFLMVRRQQPIEPVRAIQILTP